MSGMSGLDDEHPARRRAVVGEKKTLSVNWSYSDSPPRGGCLSLACVESLWRRWDGDLHSKIIAIAINIINTWW